MARYGFVVFILVAACGAIAQASEKGKFSESQICKAGIAIVMGRDPAIMHINRVQGDVIYLSYIRANDGSRWSYKCKLVGNRIIWGADNGRWRTHRADSRILFKIIGDVIHVEEDYGDGSSNQKTFNLIQLGK